MKRLFLLATIVSMIYACSDGGSKTEGTQDASSTSAGTPSYDTARGAGKFMNVEISPNLNPALADAGQKVYDVKCASCHKLTTPPSRMDHEFRDQRG
jgi:hypothetical protein